MRLRSVFALSAALGATTACSILVDTAGLAGDPLGDGGTADTMSSEAATDAPTHDGNVEAAADAGDGGALIALDEFAREIGSGFGSADLGGAWSNKPGTQASAVVTGGAARVTLQAGGGYHTILGKIGALDTDLRTDFTLDKTPSGSGIYIALTTRAVSEATSYHGTLILRESGSASARITSVIDYDEGRDVAEKSMVFDGALGSTFHVRLQATGTNPTTLRVKVWRNAEPEPRDWTVEGADDTAQLQSAGASGLDFYLSSSATVPVVCAVERFEVRAP